MATRLHSHRGHYSAVNMPKHLFFLSRRLGIYALVAQLMSCLTVFGGKGSDPNHIITHKLIYTDHDFKKVMKNPQNLDSTVLRVIC
jgi:hypothetical protein